MVQLTLYKACNLAGYSANSFSLAKISFILILLHSQFSRGISVLDFFVSAWSAAFLPYCLHNLLIAALASALALNAELIPSGSHLGLVVCFVSCIPCLTAAKSFVLCYFNGCFISSFIFSLDSIVF